MSLPNSVLNMSDLDLSGKRVLMRLDLNVPMKDGVVSDSTRIDASLPAVREAIGKGAKVILMSHLGRPHEGCYDLEYSLAPVAKKLTERLGSEVPLVTNWLNNGNQHPKEPVVLYENVRFNRGEKTNDKQLAQKMAELCDVFVMNAFGAAHRAHASTHGVAQYAPIACAGPLLRSEIEVLSKAVQNPKRPVVAIIGGAKVFTKLQVLRQLSAKVDTLIVGGGIANTFLAATRHPVGDSLFEEKLMDDAIRIDQMIYDRGGELPLPTDVVVSEELGAVANAQEKAVSDVGNNDRILDIGSITAAHYMDHIHRAGTVIWSGPVGVFEYDQFGTGTKALANAIAESKAFSLAGGGDTIAAINKYGVADRISYISTGGGAFLEFVEGKSLPGVSILEHRTKQSQLMH